MTPAEIAAAIEAFLQLEPEIQKGIVALIHLIHKPKSSYSGASRAVIGVHDKPV